MILVCVNPFGHFKPGDEIIVPDGAEFDTAYFSAKDDGSAAKADEAGKAADKADDKENG